MALAEAKTEQKRDRKAVDGVIAALAAQFGNRLVTSQAVREQHGLQFVDDRAGHAGHQLFVDDSVFEIGVHDVLRSDIGDAAVQNGNLAVIAQVQAGGLAAEEAERQHLDDLDAGRPQPRGEGAQGAPAGEGVEPACHDLDAAVPCPARQLAHAAG